MKLTKAKFKVWSNKSKIKILARNGCAPTPPPYVIIEAEAVGDGNSGQHHEIAIIASEVSSVCPENSKAPRGNLAEIIVGIDQCGELRVLIIPNYSEDSVLAIYPARSKEHMVEKLY